MAVLFFILAFFRFYFLRFAYDLALAVLIAGFLFSSISLLQNYEKLPKISKIVTFCADYSFTLYLTHQVILFIIKTNLQYGSPYFKLAVTFIVANIIAIIIALPTEMQYKKLRKYVVQFVKV